MSTHGATSGATRSVAERPRRAQSAGARVGAEEDERARSFRASASTEKNPALRQRYRELAQYHANVAKEQRATARENARTMARIQRENAPIQRAVEPIGRAMAGARDYQEAGRVWRTAWQRATSQAERSALIDTLGEYYHRTNGQHGTYNGRTAQRLTPFDRAMYQLMTDYHPKSEHLDPVANQARVWEAAGGKPAESLPARPPARTAQAAPRTSTATRAPSPATRAKALNAELTRAVTSPEDAQHFHRAYAALHEYLDSLTPAQRTKADAAIAKANSTPTKAPRASRSRAASPSAAPATTTTTRTASGNTVQTQIGPRVHWSDAADLRAATNQWAAKMGVKPASITIADLPGKWGQMDTAGHMTLSRDLLNLSPRLGEYVMAHELAHRLAPNHGPVFQSFMHAYMPDWQQREAELQQTGRSLEGGSSPTPAPRTHSPRAKKSATA